MIAVRKVKRPGGAIIGEKIVALQYNMAGTGVDMTTGETYRCPAFGKYVLRESFLNGAATPEKQAAFAEKYYANARIWWID